MSVVMQKDVRVPEATVIGPAAPDLPRVHLIIPPRKNATRKYVIPYGWVEYND